MQLKLFEICDNCNGLGFKSGWVNGEIISIKCKKCNGTGKKQN